LLEQRELRVLIYESPDDPYKSLAFEEAMWRSLRSNLIPDTLRIWRHRNAVILGYFQLAEEEVNFERAKEKGIDIVRRFTGGGAVYHDLGCLVWSIAVKGPTGGGTKFLYGDLLSGFVEALRILGVNAYIENVNDVVIDTPSGRRKVSGTAATLTENYYLLHGTLLVETDLEILSSVLKVSRAKLADKKISEVKYRVANLNDALGKRFHMSDIIDAIIKAYSKILGKKAVIDLPSKEELNLARKLYNAKYSKPEWNLLRFPSKYFEEDINRDSR